MLNFMENHDEQRIASKFFAGDAVKGFPAMAVSTLMNASPVMVYAGQELGEQAHEAEGFSGFDGRTTIFDYWKVETLCRLQSSDYRLQIGEDVVFDLYRRLLSIASREVVAEGKFYDLMWLNRGNQQFDSSRQYAFVRYTDKEALFVVANFAGEERDVRVNITHHLFDAMGCEAFGKVVAADLMTGNKVELNFSADASVEIALKPYQVCAYSVLL